MTDLSCKISREIIEDAARLRRKMLAQRLDHGIPMWMARQQVVEILDLPDEPVGTAEPEPLPPLPLFEGQGE